MPERNNSSDKDSKLIIKCLGGMFLGATLAISPFVYRAISETKYQDTDAYLFFSGLALTAVSGLSANPTYNNPTNNN